MWRRWPVGRVVHLADGRVMYEAGHQLRLDERPRGTEPRSIPEILRRPSRPFRRERELAADLNRRLDVTAGRDRHLTNHGRSE